jgi:hypothetical protein
MGKFETVMDGYREMVAEKYWWIVGFQEEPNYELLREFVYERIGIDRLRDFFDLLLVELAYQADAQGGLSRKKSGARCN